MNIAPLGTIQMGAAENDTKKQNANFADILRSLMLAQRMSASDLAREMWGTMKDARGYEVARNRDRVGHYLSGKSYPSDDNLKKLAKILRVNIETLKNAKPAPDVRGTVSAKDLQVVLFTDGSNAGTLSMPKMALSRKTITAIMDLIDKDPVHSKHHYVPADDAKSKNGSAPGGHRGSKKS